MTRALAVLLILGLAAQVPVSAQTGVPEAALTQGIQQVEEGDLDTAVITLDAVVRQLSSEKGKEKELALAHLYLGMAHLGLSQWERARSEMREAWRSDRQMKLDPKKFPPRVRQLYDEAKAEPASAPAPVPPAAEKNHGSGKVLLVVGAAGAAGGVAVLAAAGGGGDAKAAGNTSTVKTPVTVTFPFVLAASNRSGTVVGPVRAGNGSLVVTLNFSGSFIILACVGTASSCRPMGGRPATATFSIPGDFPAGSIQADVYFNTNYPQPAGDASGTVTFTYTPL